MARTYEPAAGSGSRSLAGRLRSAWKGLSQERRLAAGAAVGLFLTLFLPWYQETVIPTGVGSKAGLPSASLTGWAAFSFVEAAVLVVAVGVLLLLFVRAEGRAFHVPGGDGGVIMAAGIWTVALIVWRMFDKEGTSGHSTFVSTSGIEWGIFIALGVAGLLAYAGSRIKLVNAPEPPLPGEAPAPGSGAVRATAARTAATAAPPPPGEAPTRTLEDPEERRRQRLRRVSESPRKRDLNFSDLDAIEFDEPPEAPTIRHTPGPVDPE